METGLNDLCPCGSGKKYKKCCLAQQGPGPTDNDSVLEKRQRMLAERQFGPLAEVQAAMDRIVQLQNQAPREEFCGLSATEMHQFLNLPFDSSQIATFPTTVETAAEAPILSLFALLVEAVGEDGLKPTAKGNLPLKFCREAALTYYGEVGYREHTRYGGINREEDFFDLHRTRLVAELAGLLRKHKGKFVLTVRCRKMLTNSGLASIYPELLRAYMTKFNWAFGDRHADLPIVQRAGLFSLYLLHRYGNEPRPNQFYEEAFVRAFPMVVEEMATSAYFTPLEQVNSCYTLRTLERFAHFLGLIALKPVDEGTTYSRNHQVTALPLLWASVRFTVEK